jgi:hypothetical protein
VSTVLRRLGRDVTLDLLEHAYLLAMCNLHVLLGYPLAAEPVRQRVARLLAKPTPTGVAGAAVGAAPPTGTGRT